MPMELLEKVKNEIHSPYYAPLEILCNASVSFQYPPTKTDKKVIAALRKNWSKMMDRIWNEPEKTRRFAHTGACRRSPNCLKDHYNRPNFHILRILYEPSDLTTQIIARRWKYRNALDTGLIASALYVLLKPSHPCQIVYMRSNGLESATSQILSKILAGVGPTALPSKQQQVNAVVTTFAEHVVHLTGRSAARELDLLDTITSMANSDATEPEVLKSVLKASPLWNVVFKLLKKSAKPATNGLEPDEPQDPETEKENRLRVISNIVGTVVSILHTAISEHPRECEPLIRIWANQNLFGALEETIELIVTTPGMTMELSRLAIIIETTVMEGTPSLLRLFFHGGEFWELFSDTILNDSRSMDPLAPL